MCFVTISEQTATFALYCTDWLVFITEVESVYCAVRIESLYNADTIRLQRVNGGGVGGDCDDNHFIPVSLFRVHRGAVLKILINHPSSNSRYISKSNQRLLASKEQFCFTPLVI